MKPEFEFSVNKQWFDLVDLGIIAGMIYLLYEVLKKPTDTITFIVIILIMCAGIISLHLTYIKISSEHYTITFEENSFHFNSPLISYNGKYENMRSIRLTKIKLDPLDIIGDKHQIIVIKTEKKFKLYLCLNYLRPGEQKKLKCVLMDKSHKQIIEKGKRNY